MTPILRPQLSRLADKAGLQLERWREGTVRFTLKGSGPPTDVGPDWFKTHLTGAAYVVGREKVPPLLGVLNKRAQSRFPLMVAHRVVTLESGNEACSVAKAVLSSGWCTNNDVYVFPPDGSWLAYVGHHEELVVYANRRAR